MKWRLCGEEEVKRVNLWSGDSACKTIDGSACDRQQNQKIGTHPARAPRICCGLPLKTAVVEFVSVVSPSTLDLELSRVSDLRWSLKFLSGYQECHRHWS